MTQKVRAHHLNPNDYELADRVKQAASAFDLKVEIKSVENPRKELEEHYYNPAHSGLIELGLEPNFMTDDVLERMLGEVIEYRDRIDQSKIMPRVSWS